MALCLKCYPESFLKFGHQQKNRHMWRQEGPQGSSDHMDDVVWVLTPRGSEYTRMI